MKKGKIIYLIGGIAFIIAVVSFVFGIVDFISLYKVSGGELQLSNFELYDMIIDPISSPKAIDATGEREFYELYYKLFFLHILI